MDLIARQGEVGIEGSRRLRRSQNAGYAGAPAKPGVIPGDPILPSKAGTADRATGVTAGRSASETAESKSVATPPSLLVFLRNQSVGTTRSSATSNAKAQTERMACPDCGGELSKLGEDVSEMLEYVPASCFVVRHVRPKLSCTKCDHIVHASAPPRPIERGVAGPGLLAHVVSKYADHLP